MPDNPMVIRVEDLEFNYDASKTLDGISFECRPGEFLGLIGPNGSGKTTLLRCIDGLLRPSRGAVYLDGKDIGGMRLQEVAKLCAAVPTDAPDDFNVTVEDFIFLGRYPHVEGLWWETKGDEEIVETAIHDFRLGSLRRRKLLELSSGEKERVLLAKAAVQRPKVMLVDEPSAHLDLKFRLQAMDFLRELCGRGIAVVVASHDINLLARYCDRVLVLKAGKVVACGRPIDVITEGLIRDVYEVEAVVTSHEGVLYALARRAIP